MLEMLHDIQKKIGIDNKDIELEKGRPAHK